MSLAVWLGEERNCFAAVVGSDLASGLSMVRRCSLNRSLIRSEIELGKSEILVINRIRVLRSGPHTPRPIFWREGGGGAFIDSLGEYEYYKCFV